MALTPKTHFVHFYLTVTLHFLFWGSDTVDEAVMGKIHKKIRIGILEKGTFSTITAKVTEIWENNEKNNVLNLTPKKYHFQLIPGG